MFIPLMMNIYENDILKITSMVKLILYRLVNGY